MTPEQELGYASVTRLLKETSVNDFVETRIRPLAPGILLALAALLFGFGLGAAFGSVEHAIKDHLRSEADAVLESVYHGDSGKRDAVVRKSWSYFKRAHLHGNGLGTAALASIVLLSLLGKPDMKARAAASLFGAGALVYSTFWMFAGLTAPALGSTHDAKEALQWMAIPGAGMAILGLLGTIVSVIGALRSPAAET